MTDGFEEWLANITYEEFHDAICNGVEYEIVQRALREWYEREVKMNKITNCPLCNGQRELDGLGNYICYFCGLKEKEHEKQILKNYRRAGKPIPYTYTPEPNGVDDYNYLILRRSGETSYEIICAETSLEHAKSTAQLNCDFIQEVVIVKVLGSVVEGRE